MGDQALAAVGVPGAWRFRLERAPVLDGLRVPGCWSNYWWHATVGGMGAFLPGSTNLNFFSVFFVLTGFLTTTSLVGKRIDENGVKEPVRFVTDRARRLFPVLYWYVPFAVLIQVALGFNPLVSLITAGSVFTGTTNLLAAVGFPVGLMGHLWYVAVDLQWCLGWVIVLGWLIRHRRDWVGSALWFCAIGSVVACVFRSAVFTGGAEGRFAFAHEMLLTRADSFLVGAGAALALHRWGKPRVHWLIPAACVVWLVVSAPVYRVGGLLISNDFAIEVNGTVVSFMWAVIIVWAVCRPVGQRMPVLESRPFLFLGKISYSWYVWHLPFSAIGLLFDIPLYISAPIGLSLSTFVGWLSWRYIEVPAQERAAGLRPPRRRPLLRGRTAAAPG